MNRIFVFLVGLLASNALPAEGQSLLQPNDSIVIAGDSITEQKLYSVFMEDYLLMCQPVPAKRIAQLGWSGEQAPSFLARLDSDLYPFQPTVVTTCYGMNDGHYIAPNPVVADVYRKNQTAIVEALKSHGVRVIVLGSSKCVDSYTYNHGKPGGTPPAVYNKTLGAFGDIDRDIAQKEGVIYADVFGATVSAMEKSKAVYGDSYNFGGSDGIHPGPNGHLVMAYAFLKALGCDGAVGTLTVDMGSNQAQGSPGQKIVSFQSGTLEVESTRYPFCFQGDPTKPAPTTAGILRFVPFNEDLNRYMLVVTGLTSAKAKVTWGTASKVFSADDLKKGINLAAEFLDNPFVPAFFKVDAAVQAQQGVETPLVKGFLHNLGTMKGFLPDDSAVLDKIAADGLAHSFALYQTAAGLVTPVDYKLTITPAP
jgi:lysophospholipase L1-like esterase